MSLQFHVARTDIPRAVLALAPLAQKFRTAWCENAILRDDQIVVPSALRDIVFRTSHLEIKHGVPVKNEGDGGPGILSRLFFVKNNSRKTPHKNGRTARTRAVWIVVMARSMREE